MKHSATFFIFLLGALSLCAQQPIWQALERPWGIRPNNAIINSLGHLFAMDNGGLYRSMDMGENWEVIDDQKDKFIYPYRMGPTPDGSVFVSSEENLYVVRPGSNTLELVVLPSRHVDFAVNPSGDLFIIESFRTIHRSTDGGRNFTKFLDETKTDGWPQAMHFFGNNQNFLVSAHGASGYLWHISDDGSNVERILLPGGFVELSMLRHPSGKLFLWTEDGEAYCSDDGKTWVTFKITAAPYTDVDYMFCDPAGKLYASNQGILYESSDKANAWVKSVFPAKGFRFVRYAADGSSSLIGTYCDVDGGLLLSRDNWATSEILDDRFNRSSAYNIQKDGKGRLHVRTCANTLISEDDGKNWSRYGVNGTSPDQLVFTKSGRAFALINADTAWYVSYDGGDTWQQKTNMIARADGIQNIKEGFDGNLYGWGFSNLFKSTDFGETWKPIGKLPSHFSGEVWIHPNGDLYVGDYFIFRSSDGGLTWNRVNFSNETSYHATAFHITNQGLILVGVVYESLQLSYVSYVSLDGGLTFQILPPPPNASFSFDWFYSNDAGDVFGETHNSLFISKDRCKTWALLSGGLPSKNIDAFFCDAQNHLYISFYEETVYKSQNPISHPNIVRGRAFSDSNTNCAFETGEALRPFQLLKATGNTEYYRVSKLDGAFALDLPDGQYTVSAVPPSPIWDACPPTVVNLVAGQADSARVDLGLKTLAHCADLKVGLSTAFLRRCFSNAYYLHISNEGNAPASGVAAVVTLDTLMEYESANFPLRAQQGQTFTFDIGDLPAGQARVLKIQLKISCDADLGQMHCVSVELTPQPNCSVALPAHHTARECRPNQGAYDPNDKQAFANGLPLTGKVPPNTELEYLIRFQNTGTDTAFTVAVSDRLSPKLDLQSVRPGVSSHPYRYEIREDRTLRFIFDNIALPDSNTNEPASHGFVKFSVKPIATVPLGDKIANVADIYFDFNAPVRTNTVDLTVELPTATREPAPALHCLVSPNPARDAFTVQWERNGRAWSGSLQLELFDATGRAALRQTASGTQTTVSRGELPSGLYWLKVAATDGSFARAKVVLE